MSTLFCKKALLPDGWANDVRLCIDDGRVSQLKKGVKRNDGEQIADCVIPGLANAHSHAFQRALAGRTEERSPVGQDNFWTWRARMYELAAVMTAERLHAIAAQAYSEMLASGYTAVAEFHYLHNDSGGMPGDEMFDAIRRAAIDAGIRLTYVPVLYERAGFDRPEPEGAQALFAQDLDGFLAHHDRAATAAADTLTVAIGAHSLRAVGPESLRSIAEAAQAHGVPMHIHIAEQQAEIDQSRAAYGCRPVRWLLENFDVDANWCLVHATHMDAEEIAKLAQSEAVVCLCPSTEANLGDGLFPLAEFLSQAGRIAIGSDSHVSINPFEELRWLEYGQRLVTRTRNVAAMHDPHVGRGLFEQVRAGGVQACGNASAEIAKGDVADLVCLYGDDPMLVGHSDASRLDALVFSGYHLPIEHVMVAGRWCVVDGKHISRDESRAAFARAVGEIAKLRSEQ